MKEVEERKKPNYIVIGVMLIGFISISAGVISVLKTSK